MSQQKLQNPQQQQYKQDLDIQNSPSNAANQKMKATKIAISVVNGKNKSKGLQVSKIEETFHNEFGKNTLEYDHIIEECQHLKFGDQQWQDPAFPSNARSLSLTFNKLPLPVQKQWNDIKWKRPSEFLDKDKIVLFDTIEPNDIKQGLLGDCYFLCALSALAEQDQLIQRLFHTKEKQKYGVYSVWLNISGEWVNVNIDDAIPFYNRGPAFSRGQGDEIWVLLLEKAYAKVYGSYEIIEGGNPSFALRDLTGAPCENLDNLTANEFWKYLEENDNQKNVLTCYTKQTDVREEENELGILSGHAYSILDHQTVRGNDNGLHRILKIRNPWGKKEWTGDWSDKSPCWNPMLRQKLKVVDENDGTFWISIEDFAKHFEGIGNCKVRCNYVYNSIKLDFNRPKDPHNFKDIKYPEDPNIRVVQFTVKDYTHVFISANQMDERMFTNSPFEYSYSYCRMFILKKDSKDQYSYIGAIYDINRNMFIETSLHPGEYIVLTQFFWEQENVKTCTISSYSEKPISFVYLKNIDEKEMLKICFKCVAIESISRKEQKHTNYVVPANNWNYPLLSKRYGFQYGSFYIYYNNGEAQQILNEKLHFTMKGYIPQEPYFSPQMFISKQYNEVYKLDIDITIPGDREAVILFDCHGQEYSYKFSSEPSFYSLTSERAKLLKIDESTLLKVEKKKLQVQMNISSFGRSQHLGQVTKAIAIEPQLKFLADTPRASAVVATGAGANPTAPGQVQSGTVEPSKTVGTPEEDSKDLPELEQECLDFFDEYIGSKITAWGRLINWLTFMMFPLFFCQAFAKDTSLDVMIAMSMVNLINAEALSEFFLRKIILAMYVSIIVDVVFIFNSSEQHGLLTGQSLTAGAHYFSFIFMFIGIGYKIFVAFTYLHVWKNFLSTMPYIYQGYRKIKYFLRDLQLDEETIARFTQQQPSNTVSPLQSQNPSHQVINLTNNNIN